MPGIDLTGHVAVVTGGNHGIGAATARRLAHAGASVLVTYLRFIDEPDAAVPDEYRKNRAADGTQVVDDIRGSGGKAIQLEADLSDAEAPTAIFEAAETALGPVDILINNASGWMADTFSPEVTDRFERTVERVSAESVDRLFVVDARASALLISEYSIRHEEHDLSWGRIVGLTSGGPLGFPQEVSYGAAKAALENYTMSAAFELAHRGITANVIHPAVTDTGWVSDGVRKFVESQPELIHVAQPEGVAEVIAFICSNDAKLITANRIHLR